MDNLATSIRHIGVILVDLIPKIYNGPRIARIIGEDGEEENVPINQPHYQDDEGNKLPIPMGAPVKDDMPVFNLETGKYDVVVDVDPSYASKRQEAVDSIIEIAKAEPRVLEVAGDLLFKSLDVPYAQEIAERLKAIMDPAILGDDPMAAKLQAASQAMQEMEKQLNTMQMAIEDKAKDKELERTIELGELQDKKKNTEIKAAKTMAEIEKMKAESGAVSPEAIQELMNILQGQEDNAKDVGMASHQMMEYIERLQDMGILPTPDQMESGEGEKRGFFGRLFKQG